jgi:hypothetical protein
VLSYDHEVAMAIPLMLFALALAGCSAVAIIFGRSARQRRSTVLLWAVVGYIAGGATIWLLTPPEWTLSFPQTLAASVDSQTYGHPIEHYAESLLAVMLVASVFGSIVFSAIGTFGGRLLRPTRLHDPVTPAGL